MIAVVRRAASKTMQQPDFSAEGSQAPQPTATCTNDSNSVSARNTVRQAMIALASSDAFVDAIVQQLQANGLLQ